MSTRVMMRRRRLALRMTVAASVWSLGLLLGALLLPAFNDQTVSSSSGLTLRTATFVQVNGAWVLVPVALPVVVSVVVAVAIRQRRLTGPSWADLLGWLVVGVLAVLTLVTILTIGALMIPVVVLLALALRVAPGPRAQRPGRRPREQRDARGADDARDARAQA